jgi:hypothetical protein
MRLARRLDSVLMMLFASRWLTTCIVAGLTCAWSWERSV